MNAAQMAAEGTIGLSIIYLISANQREKTMKISRRFTRMNAAQMAAEEKKMFKSYKKPR